MEYILQTERLNLRKFRIDDTKFIIDLVNSPGWIEFIGDRNIKTLEEAKNYLDNGPIKSYEVNGYGLSLVELKNEKGPIGMCGIIKRDNLENPDIGFAFLPDFIGKGYAFEIANATMSYAKEKLNLSIIYAITVSNNKPSINLLEKLGMKFIKLFCLPNDDDELMLFSNTKS